MKQIIPRMSRVAEPFSFRVWFYFQNLRAMQTYYFDTLLFFFQAQKSLNYTAIEIIVGILEDEELPDEDKRDGILYIMRKYGLNETTVNNGSYEPKESKWKFPTHLIESLDSGSYHQAQMTQMIPVKMMNGSVIFEFCLN